jgi:hypothetical protein
MQIGSDSAESATRTSAQFATPYRCTLLWADKTAVPDSHEVSESPGRPNPANSPRPQTGDRWGNSMKTEPSRRFIRRLLRALRVSVVDPLDDRHRNVNHRDTENTEELRAQPDRRSTAGMMAPVARSPKSLLQPEPKGCSVNSGACERVGQTLARLRFGHAEPALFRFPETSR